jgi:hypothetical protein
MKTMLKHGLFIITMIVMILGLEVGCPSPASSSDDDDPPPNPDGAISWVDVSGSYYDRLVLAVDGEPFFYNGIQIRIDKLRDGYGYTEDQVKNTFAIAKNDGFTVINAQILWQDIQPDKPFKAMGTAHIKGGANSTTNYSSEAVNSISLSYQKDSSDSQSLGYIKFNNVSLDGEWTGAKLRVYVNGLSGTNNGLGVYGIENDSWNPNTITWDNAPNHTGYDVSGGGS